MKISALRVPVGGVAIEGHQEADDLGREDETIVPATHHRDDRDHEPTAEFAEVLEDRHPAFGVALLFAERHGTDQAGALGASGSALGS